MAKKQNKPDTVTQKAMEYFGIPAAEVTFKQRAFIKQTFFSENYGMGKVAPKANKY